MENKEKEQRISDIRKINRFNADFIIVKKITYKILKRDIFRNKKNKWNKLKRWNG